MRAERLLLVLAVASNALLIAAFAGAQADLGVSLTSNLNPAAAGGPVTLTMRVTNHGPDDETAARALLSTPFRSLDFLESPEHTPWFVATSHGSCDLRLNHGGYGGGCDDGVYWNDWYTWDC